MTFLVRKQGVPKLVFTSFFLSVGFGGPRRYSLSQTEPEQLWVLRYDSEIGDIVAWSIEGRVFLIRCQQEIRVRSASLLGWKRTLVRPRVSTRRAFFQAIFHHLYCPCLRGWLVDDLSFLRCVSWSHYSFSCSKLESIVDLPLLNWQFVNLPTWPFMRLNLFLKACSLSVILLNACWLTCRVFEVEIPKQAGEDLDHCWKKTWLFDPLSNWYIMETTD